jgi:pSer/pThr/pTyr-binding forkhead associated (FHA) protein
VFTLNEIQHALQVQQRIIPLLLEECEGPLKLRLNHINWLDLRDGRDPVTSVVDAIQQPRVALPDYPVAQLMAVDEYADAMKPPHHMLMIPNHIIPTELPFTVKLCTFGRLAQPTVNLVIDQGYVSRSHASIRAQIKTDGVDFVLIDHGSRNHTFVNGERIKDEYVLHDGDQIGLGRSTAMVLFSLVPETAFGDEDEDEDEGEGEDG